MGLTRTLVFVSVLLSLCTVSSSPQQDTACASNMSLRLRTFRLVMKCNSTTLKEKQVEQIQAPTTNLYLPILYLLAFSVGLPSNLLALWVLVFQTKRLPSTTLLINLTVADCLLLLVLPFRIVYHLRGNHWDLGEPFCRTVMAMFYGNTYGSVWCLALVALDRYVALVHPFGAKTLRTWQVSVYMSGSVWVVMLAAMLPLLMSQQTYRLEDPRITTCHDALPESEHETFFLPYFSSLFATCFLLPFIIVMYCHSAVLRTLLAAGKCYSHAIRATVLVMVVFIVCLLPSNILLLLTYSDTWLDGDGEEIYVPYMVSLAVGTFNSCIDPFIYYYVSTEFRQKAKSLLGCLGQKQIRSSQGINTSSSGKRSKVTLLSMTNQQGTSDKSIGAQGDKVIVT